MSDGPPPWAGPVARMLWPERSAGRDLCSRCGSRFPSAQACEACVTDAERVRGAVAVLRRHRQRRTFTGDVLVRVLERLAERLERG